MVQLVQLPATGRVPRSPKHDWHIRHQPFVIQPHLIAPVLPGETLKRAVMQTRAVTAPIRNALIGWHYEQYYFYVKLRDLDGRADFEDMMLDLSKDLSSYTEAANVNYYHHTGTIPWAKLCLKRVVEEYFRDEGEAWDDYTLDGMPISAVSRLDWMQSLTPSSEIAETTVVNEAGSSTHSSQDLIDAQNTWLHLRQNGLTQMDFEDYLRSFGVRLSRDEPHKPELLRYIREWVYPSNTIDPSDGSASSACSWALSERMDKDRFFIEPGFIFGVSLARPKVYKNNQYGTATEYLNNALNWLPAIMSDDPATSLNKKAASSGPLDDTTVEHWFDIRDLFIYGEQFTNVAVTDTNMNFVALPSVGAGNPHYPDETSIDALFVGVSGGLVTADGTAQLTIHGRQVDQT